MPWQHDEFVQQRLDKGRRLLAEDERFRDSTELWVGEVAAGGFTLLTAHPWLLIRTMQQPLQLSKCSLQGKVAHISPLASQAWLDYMDWTTRLQSFVLTDDGQARHLTSLEQRQVRSCTLLWIGNSGRPCEQACHFLSFRTISCH